MVLYNTVTNRTFAVNHAFKLKKNVIFTKIALIELNYHSQFKKNTAQFYFNRFEKKPDIYFQNTFKVINFFFQCIDFFPMNNAI